MNISKEQFFKRQTTLSEIGKAGQEKLLNAKVLIVGCGGLGSPTAVYLAASGIGEIHLVDFDTVDVTNLHRQVYYSLEDVGKPKVEMLVKFLKDRAPFTKVSFTNTALTKDNVINLISNYDIIVDGTDSLPTKYLLNDACVLVNKPLVYGSLYKFDGYVSVFNQQLENGTRSANLRDAFPVMATDIPNCEEAGTLNPIVGIIALQQANEVIKLITGIGKTLCNELLIYNALQNTQLKMKLQSKVSKEEIQEMFDKETYFDASCEIQNSEWLITAEELQEELDNSNIEIVGVLKDIEYPFTVSKIISIDSIVEELIPDETKKYVLVCKKGLTSYTATKLLREKYPKTTIFSLIGGIKDYE